jgi:uncharacterized protein (DUF2237 family)
MIAHRLCQQRRSMAGQDKALAEGTVKLLSATCAVSCAMLCYRPHWLYSPIGGDSWHLAARKWQQAHVQTWQQLPLRTC